MSWRFCQDVGLLSNKMELNGTWPVLFRYMFVAQSKKKIEIEILNCNVRNRSVHLLKENGR